MMTNNNKVRTTIFKIKLSPDLKLNPASPP
jgi:hypothetical protein